MKIRAWHNKLVKGFRNETIDQILRGLPYVAVGLVLGLLLFGNDTLFQGSVLSYFTNVWTEGVSIVITVVILDRLASKRAEKAVVASLKTQLVREAGSSDNATALNALRALRANDWLEGNEGVLQGADLTGANLSGANLAGANLSGAILARANLSDVTCWHDYGITLSLGEVNLSGAYLGHANLARADLERANLSQAGLIGAKLNETNLKSADLSMAILWNTDLSSANLDAANLRGAYSKAANLSGADLKNAQLQNALIPPHGSIGPDLFRDGEVDNSDKFDENTTFPNGTKWSPDIDMAQFGVFTNEEIWLQEWVSKQPDSYPVVQAILLSMIAL